MLSLGQSSLSQWASHACTRFGFGHGQQKLRRILHAESIQNQGGLSKKKLQQAGSCSESQYVHAVFTYIYITMTIYLIYMYIYIYMIVYVFKTPTFVIGTYVDCSMNTHIQYFDVTSCFALGACAHKILGLQQQRPQHPEPSQGIPRCQAPMC